MYGIYDRDKEIKEAIRAGDRALGSPREAQRQLNSALYYLSDGINESVLMKGLRMR